MDSDLEKQLPANRHRYLVFSSVGDQSNLRHWLRGRRNFDLWVTYYGSHSGRYRDVADYYSERRGSKFQNLHHAYQQGKDLLGRYSAILVMDDDVLISGTRISRLFELREQHDLWALQPAFSPRGKISWPITRARRMNTLRFTNFIEMTCPLFRRDKLDAFMAVYDPELVGWGCDWWFLESLGPDLRERVAVVDSITCLNPHDVSKLGGREIDRLSRTQERRATWERIKRTHGIENDEHRGFIEYDAITKPALAQALGRLTDAAEQRWLRMRSSQHWPMPQLRRLRDLALEARRSRARRPGADPKATDSG